MSQTDLSFHRPLSYYAGTTEAKKEKARQLLERERMKEGLSGKLRARYLQGRESDKDFVRYVDEQISQLLSHRKFHETDLKHLDELLGYAQIKPRQNARSHSAHFVRAEAKEHHRPVTSHQSTRAQTPSHEEARSGDYDWESFSMLQAEQTRKAALLEHRRAKEKQLETREQLIKQMHEKESRKEREKLSDIEFAHYEMIEAERRAANDDLRQDERRARDYQNALDLRNQIKVQKSQNTAEKIQLKCLDAIDNEHERQLLLMSRRIEAQKKKEIQEQMRESAKQSREDTQRYKPKVEKDPGAKLSILVEQTDQERQQQMKEKFLLREARQELISTNMASYMKKMKEEEDRRAEETRKYEKMLEDKLEEERERIYQQRLALQDIIIRETGQPRSRISEDGGKVRGSIGTLSQSGERSSRPSTVGSAASINRNASLTEIPGRVNSSQNRHTVFDANPGLQSQRRA